LDLWHTHITLKASLTQIGLVIKIKESQFHINYVFICSDGSDPWQCHHQPTIALSSIEAEYIAYALATKEANN